jgi:hypothetical protein
MASGGCTGPLNFFARAKKFTSGWWLYRPWWWLGGGGHGGGLQVR